MDEPIKEPTTKPDTVTMTQEQLSALLGRIANLESGQRVVKPTRVSDRTAVLRFYNGKPVVGLRGYREILDETNNRVAVITLDLFGGDNLESVEVPYLSFLNEGNGEKVKIVKQEAQKHVKSDGQVRAVNPDPMNQKTWEGGLIDLEVVSYTYKADVEVIEGPHAGEKYTVPAECLNL